jgi:cell division protein FtsB
MSVVLEIRRRGRHVIGSILGALIFAYFLFHAVQGDRGLLAWIQIRQRIVEAEAQHAITSAERASWEHQIALMRSSHLDADMLDERVRLVTGLGHKDERVIYYVAPITPTASH